MRRLVFVYALETIIGLIRENKVFCSDRVLTIQSTERCLSVRGFFGRLRTICSVNGSEVSCFLLVFVSQVKRSSGRTRRVMSCADSRFRRVWFWRECSFYPKTHPEGTCAGNARSGPTDDQPLWEWITEKSLVKGYRYEDTSGNRLNTKLIRWWWIQTPQENFTVKRHLGETSLIF